jgi:hypothetical protein
MANAVSSKQRLLVDQGRIALDHAGILQRPHAAQAGRGGQPDALGQRYVRERAVAHEFAHNAAVDGVQAKGHGSSLREYGRNPGLGQDLG